MRDSDTIHNNINPATAVHAPERHARTTATKPSLQPWAVRHRKRQTTRSSRGYSHQDYPTSFRRRYTPSHATAAVSFTMRSNAGSVFGPRRQRYRDGARSARMPSHWWSSSAAVGRASGRCCLALSMRGTKNCVLLYFWAGISRPYARRSRDKTYLLELVVIHIPKSEDVDLERVVRDRRRQLRYVLVAPGTSNDVRRCTLRDQ